MKPEGVTTRRAFVAQLVAAALLPACSRAHARPSGAVAERVVSLSPSTTEAMFALGAGAQLVGRSRYCDFPREALALPQVGGYVDPNLEAILALRPDLVVGARGPAGPKYVDDLAARGVATFVPETVSLAAIDAMIRGLGDRTGHADEAAREVARIDSRVEVIARATSWLPKVRVLLVFGLDPIVVAGPAGFPNELLGKAGAVNAVTEGGAYPTVGIEHVIALDPDTVLDASMGESGGAARITRETPGWREVDAVKRGHVATLGDEVVLRPGPRVDQGLALLARAIHPDAKLP
jgi:iron complex transport system substrate-binding protein